MSDPRPTTSHRPPTLADLRQAHDAVVRQFRIARLAAAGTMVVVALILGFMVTAILPGLGGLVAGGVVLVGFLAVFAGLIAFSAGRDRRHEGPAGPGPSSFGQVVTSAPGQQVWAAASSALAAAGFAPPRTTDPHTVVSTHSLSMASWGETLSLRVQPTLDGRGLVTVWSRPAYPLQWLDYGRSRRFANAVLTAIPDVHETVRQPTRVRGGGARAGRRAGAEHR